MPIQSTPTNFDTVVDALRDVHDEASLWRLSDELVKVAPSGVAVVEQVVAAAKTRGIPTKSANTLRLYRDVAHRFPVSERVELVSFSAHREAIAVGDVKLARKTLEDLAAKHGPAGVTVTTVKQAIGAATGKVPAKKAAAKSSTYRDLAVDLESGGKAFIAELDALVATNGVTLDGMHAGLTAVLTAVEAKRSKANRKSSSRSRKPVDPSKSPAARKAKAAANRAASKSKHAPAKAAAGKAGDLRDL